MIFDILADATHAVNCGKVMLCHLIYLFSFLTGNGNVSKDEFLQRWNEVSSFTVYLIKSILTGDT